MRRYLISIAYCHFSFQFVHHIVEFSAVKLHRPSGSMAVSVSVLRSKSEARFITTHSCSFTALPPHSHFNRTFAETISCLLDTGVE